MYNRTALPDTRERIRLQQAQATSRLSLNSDRAPLFFFPSHTVSSSVRFLIRIVHFQIPWLVSNAIYSTPTQA